MSARPIDLAPARPTLPDAGLARGWEVGTLLAVTGLLVAAGFVTLYSASAFMARQEGLPDWFFVGRQIGGAFAGLALMLVCLRVPYMLWQKLAWPLVVVCSLLLIVTILPGTEAIAPEINGARRWIRLGVTFQPSDPAKIAMIVWTAMLAVRKQGQFQSLSRGLVPFLLVWSVLLVPIALEPDLSTACLVALVGALVVYAGGGRIAHFAFLGLLAIPLLVAQLGVGFRAERLRAFLDPASVAQGAGYQVTQSMIAIGSGGIAGQGFGEGRQKYGFLPEAHNDFIFAMIGEEWGLVGVTLVLALYLVIVAVGFRIARRAPDLFGQLIAVGCTSLIAIHAVLHMAVGLGLVPTTGLALPFMSYGRSNLVVSMMAVGILASVAREIDRDWRPEHDEARRAPDIYRTGQLVPVPRTSATRGGRV